MVHTSYIHLPSISSNYENEREEHATKFLIQCKKMRGTIFIIDFCSKERQEVFACTMYIYR